jgi:hypothetical protein
MNRDVKTLAAWVKKEWPGRGIPDAVHAAAERLAAPRKRVARDVGPDRKAERKATKAQARRATRPIVVERAGGYCEAKPWISTPCGGRLVWDHFFGRGKVPPDHRLEWMICADHDAAKTANAPSRAAWMVIFHAHARNHGYDEAAVMAHNAHALEVAQHPEARAPRGGRQEGRMG